MIITGDLNVAHTDADLTHPSYFKVNAAMMMMVMMMRMIMMMLRSCVATVVVLVAVVTVEDLPIFVLLLMPGFR